MHELVERLMTDKHPDARLEAAQSLLAKGWHPKDNLDRAYLYVALQEWNKAKEIGFEATEGLLLAADGTRFAVQRSAMKILQKVIDTSAVYAVPVLMGMLSDDDDYLVSGAAGCLGKVQDWRATEPLISLLQKYENMSDYGYYGKMKIPIVAALAELNDPRAIRPLTLLSQCEHQEKVAWEIKLALRKLQKRIGTWDDEAKNRHLE